jgi:glycosyltransferase involved in cell wall biosynthesis
MTLPVSVVIPACNRADLLPRALASVHSQQPEPPSEVIVVDDCSTDATAEVAAQFGARVIRHERNLGESGARNTGIAAASHDWIALLDSDDEWLPHHLATLWPLRRDYVLVGGATLWLGMDSKCCGFGGTLRTTRVSPSRLVFPENFLSCDAVLVCKHVVEEVGGFNPQIRYAADMDLWIRVVEHGAAIAVPEVVAIWHLHPGQVTTDRQQMWAGREQVIRSYSDRTWWSVGLLEQARAVNAWDSARLAIRQGDRRQMFSDLRFIARRPIRVSAVGRTWVRRQRLRRRAAQLESQIHAATSTDSRWRASRGTGPRAFS